jgi:hypothetical protein
MCLGGAGAALALTALCVIGALRGADARWRDLPAPVLLLLGVAALSVGAAPMLAVTLLGVGGPLAALALFRLLVDARLGALGAWRFPPWAGVFLVCAAACALLPWPWGAPGALAALVALRGIRALGFRSIARHPVHTWEPLGEASADQTIEVRDGLAGGHADHVVANGAGEQGAEQLHNGLVRLDQPRMESLQPALVAVQQMPQPGVRADERLIVSGQDQDVGREQVQQLAAA